MAIRQFHAEVKCQWDPEAKVWFVAHSNVPGLSTEAESEAAMLKRLIVLIPELITLNELDGNGEQDVPLELVYTRNERIRLTGT